MFAGAAVWSSTGTDLWASLSDGTIADYLVEVEGNRGALTLNLVLWIVGATALGAGGSVVAGRESHPAGHLARFVYLAGAVLAVVSFTVWLGLVRVGASLDAATAELVGFAVTRLDDVATLALIGVGPVCVALASPSWMGRRLKGAAGAVALASLLSLVAMFTDSAMSYGFVIVPVGLLWTLAAGVSVARRSRG
jgi:hypothetical protein